MDNTVALFNDSGAIIMFNFIIQLLVLSSIDSLNADETLTEFHFNGNLPQTFQDSLCPEAADIAPCVCIYESEFDTLNLNCTDISSDEELANILAKEFPVNDFYQLILESSSSLTALDFACGDVKFRRFYLYRGPFPSLVEVSDNFYESCSYSELELVVFSDTQLSSLVFPPPPLSDKITDFEMRFSNLASVPAISSASLSYLNLANSQISQITPGTFDDIPNLRSIYLNYNNIKILESGSIPITYNGHVYHFNSNGLETIEPGAFFLKGDPNLKSLYIFLSDNVLKTIDVTIFEFLMPYIYILDISDNPLDCGCDLAWVILNPEYMAKVTNDGKLPTCADGTLLTDLDPTTYEEFCL